MTLIQVKVLTRLAKKSFKGIAGKRLTAAMARAKIDIHRIRSDPDPVPHFAGNRSGLIRSLAFTFRVFGSNGGNMAASPHTFPYTAGILGL